MPRLFVNSYNGRTATVLSAISGVLAITFASWVSGVSWVIFVIQYAMAFGYVKAKIEDVMKKGIPVPKRLWDLLKMGSVMQDESAMLKDEVDTLALKLSFEEFNRGIVKIIEQLGERVGVLYDLYDLSTITLRKSVYNTIRVRQHTSNASVHLNGPKVTRKPKPRFGSNGHVSS